MSELRDKKSINLFFILLQEKKTIMRYKLSCEKKIEIVRLNSRNYLF